MKFKVQATVLSKKLDNLHKIARNKTTLHILDYFKMEVSDDVVMLTASDLDVTLIAKVVPEEVAEVGSTCVLADKFAEIVKKVGDVMLTISLQGNNAVVKSKSGTFKIPCTSAEDFPMTREPQDEVPISINSSAIVSGIEKTFFATYKGEMEPAITGVFADFKTDKTAFVATNKVVVGVSYSEPVSALERSVILTPKFASTIMSVLSQAKETVEVLFDDRNIKLSTTEHFVYGKLVEAQYVPYHIALSNSVNTIVTVQTEEFLKAIDRVMLFCPVMNNILQIQVLVGKVSISAEDLDFNFSAEEEVVCDNKEGSGAFLCNARFLYEIVQRVKSPTLEISFSDTMPTSYFNPVGVEEDYTYVLLKLNRLN
jgi:DNA polymerase-3 subunit beta